MRNAIAILPVVSAIYPMITGATAPPTIVMISNEEASLVFVPASLNASENIVGNMILSPRYRAKNAMSDKVLLHTVTIYISIHPLNRLYLKAIQEMLKIKNDWI